MRTSKQNCGFQAEQEARDFLEKQGLKFVDANYRCKAGEIDLIMRDGEFLVFVEVRYRKLSGFGDGVESVTKSKQRKLISAARYYLLEQNLFDKIPCRFDVVAASPDSTPQILSVKDAFWQKG
jgi:putative endonuclease